MHGYYYLIPINIGRKQKTFRTISCLGHALKKPPSTDGLHSDFNSNSFVVSPGTRKRRLSAAGSASKLKSKSLADSRPPLTLSGLHASSIFDPASVAAKYNPATRYLIHL